MKDWEKKTEVFVENLQDIPCLHWGREVIKKKNEEKRVFSPGVN